MKILIIYASAGAGHLKAAEAIYNGLKNSTDHETAYVDALDYSSLLFQKTYSPIYFFLISKLPWLWAVSFSLLDQPFLQPLIRIFRRINNILNTRRLVKYIIDEEFDYVITSHFMPVEVVSALKRQGKIASKLITIVTDYDVHHIWLGSDVDIYCVATSWTKEKLVTMGVEESKIHVTGIPTDLKFSQAKDISALKQRLGVEDNHFTVLMATGSFGIGPIQEVIDAVKDVQMVVVCGHNKSLYETLSAKNYPNLRVFPLVNNMDELMAISDVMITKPGGLSISEALVCGLPMIFFSAIPGQETNNIKVLKDFGVGLKGFEIAKIVEHITNFNNSPEVLSSARQKAQSLARPDAVNEIIRLIQ